MNPTPTSGSASAPATREETARATGFRTHRVSSWQRTGLTVLLAGLAAFLGARLGTPPAARQAEPLSERVFEALDKDKGISAEQRERIRAIGARYSPVREELRLRSRAVNVALTRLMAEEGHFGPQTAEALAQLQLVMAERLKLSLEYMLEVRQALTPEQKALFDERLAREASQAR